ncbi:MAG: DUF1800 family protein [Candidatus Methylacidiphilales bacterium]
MRLVEGRSQVLTFEVATKATEVTLFPLRAEPEDAIEVLSAPRVLAGQSQGYMRIRPRGVGRSTLHLGGARLDVEASPAALAAWASHLPVVVSPISGSHVWGSISVAVEAFVGDSSTKSLQVELRAGDGTVYQPVADTGGVKGAWRRFIFEIEMSDDKQGWMEFTPVLFSEGGKELNGNPLRLYGVQPDPLHLVAGECEDHLVERQGDRFGNKPPVVVDWADASGGRCVASYSNNPPWILKTEIRQAGEYQLFMTVRGQEGGGALPSVGVYVDESERTVSNARLARADWHRLPIGPPVTLEPGMRELIVQFRNDFNANKVDRNLWFDRYELALVTPGKATHSTTDDEMMTQMDPMPPQGDDNLKNTEHVWLAFNDSLHGKKIHGNVVLSARCRWDGVDTAQTPAVTLVLNGKPVATQYGPHLRFELGQGHFQPGSNEIYLESRVGEAIFRSVKQELIHEVPESWKAPEATTTRVFGILDPAWDAGMTQRWVKRDKQIPREAAFFSNGESEILLPEDLSGNFTVELEGRGSLFEGPPILDVLFQKGSETTHIGNVEMWGDQRTRRAGQVRLEPGPKKLIVRFGNDRYEKEGDRNAWLRAVYFRELGEETNQPSEVKISMAYPGNGEKVGRYGLVVLDGYGWLPGDRAGIRTSTGKWLGYSDAPDNGLGYWIVPWANDDPSSKLDEIHLMVTRKDEMIHEQRVRVQGGHHGMENSYERAVHLLDRFGYGPQFDLLAEILLSDPRSWLETQLREPSDSPRMIAMEEWGVLRFPARGGRPQDVTGRVLEELKRSPNPVRSRFVMWIQNHFSTWMQKTGADTKWQEHRVFSSMGAAHFRDLLFASATSPAMLFYLDQHRSFAKRLNENYAREILELHTVGVGGGYQQQDVTALAHVLTGWSRSEESNLSGRGHDLVPIFRFEPALNDRGEHTVMGMRLDKINVESDEHFDRVMSVLEMLSLHPQTARYVARKLTAHYAGFPASDPMVDDIAEVFLTNGGDMVPVLLALADHPHFWQSYEKPRLTTPMDYALRLSRMQERGEVKDTGNFLKRSGMGIFDRATPDGYPEEDAAYADSNAMLQRWRWSEGIPAQRLGVPWEKEDTAKWTSDQKRLTVDLAAMRLLGKPLDGRSREAALKWLDTQSDNKIGNSMWAILARLPESHLR